ncbi:hypothetical protein [Veillonella rogosae]|nr:hypothetical protein [Veillonella rogosae]
MLNVLLGLIAAALAVICFLAFFILAPHLCIFLSSVISIVYLVRRD